MKLFSDGQLIELRHIVNFSDREIRSDLYRGFIKTENDYTSQLTAAIRRNINCYSTTGLTATSFIVDPGVERKSGVDAAIVLSSQTHSKVGLFEAKWPRFNTPYYRWDHPQTASGLSHFSDQLRRQEKIDPRYAVFEIFYNEFPFTEQPPFLFDEVSNCVWRDEIVPFRDARTQPDGLWEQADLQSLFEKKTQTLGDIIVEIGICKKGKALAFDQSEILARHFEIDVPVLAISSQSAKD